MRPLRRVFRVAACVEFRHDQTFARGMNPRRSVLRGTLAARVVLRFFENKSLREVGLASSASEGAVKKRVARALERLWTCFHKRGVRVPAAVLARLISTHAVQAAPAGLAKSVASLAVVKGTTAPASTLALVKGRNYENDAPVTNENGDSRDGRDRAPGVHSPDLVATTRFAGQYFRIQNQYRRQWICPGSGPSTRRKTGRVREL